MRWWVSALLVACTTPPPPRPPPPACRVDAVSCAAAPDDDSALALAKTACAPCHAPGGRAGLSLDTIGALRASPVADVLSTCEMPLTGMNRFDRGRLVAWARCR